MGNELRSPRNLVKAIKKYNRYKRLSETYAQENNIGFDNSKLKGIDIRDLYLFVVLRHGLNLSDQEFNQKYGEVVNDLRTNPDKLVEEYFNWYEKIDYQKQSSVSSKKAEKLIMVNRWSQQYGTIIDKNKEAFDKRYNTIEKQIYSDSLTSTNTLFCSALTSYIRKVTKYDVVHDRYYDNELHQMFLETTLDAETVAQYDAALKLGSITDYQNAKKDSVEIEFPEICAYSKEIFENKYLNKNTEFPSKYQEVSGTSTLHTILDASICNQSSFNGMAIKGIKNAEFKNIYVDGKNLYELMQDHPSFKKVPPKSLAGLILSENVMAGKAVDVCQSYIEKDGRISTRIVPISFKPDAKTKAKLHDEYLKKNHPIRYRFFNWGPFRLKKVDVLKLAKEENKRNMQERHANIFEHRNTTFLAELNAVKKVELEVGSLINVPTPVNMNQPRQVENTTQRLEIQDNDLGIEVNNNNQIVLDNELSKDEQVKEV